MQQSVTKQRKRAARVVESDVESGKESVVRSDVEGFVESVVESDGEDVIESDCESLGLVYADPTRQLSRFQ